MNFSCPQCFYPIRFGQNFCNKCQLLFPCNNYHANNDQTNFLQNNILLYNQFMQQSRSNHHPLNKKFSTSSRNCQNININSQNYKPVKTEKKSYSQESSPLIRLPLEIWLSIFDFLSYEDRANLASTCRFFSKLVNNSHLWRIIKFSKRQNISDNTLNEIGRKKPSQIHFFKCKGDKVTPKGIYQLFGSKNETLTHFSFVGSTLNEIHTDRLLLTCSTRCRNLRHIDISSLKKLRNKTLISISHSVPQLVTLLLNGAHLISNHSIESVTAHHHSTLERLELFGCFRLNSDIFECLAKCYRMRHLALGYLKNLKNSEKFIQTIKSMPYLRILDISGTNFILGSDEDADITGAALRNLERFIVSNYRPLKKPKELTSSGLSRVLSYLKNLKSFDICGVTIFDNECLRSVNGASYNSLKSMDITCTSVTPEGLSNFLYLSFLNLERLWITCSDDLEPKMIRKIIQHLSRLSKLHLFQVDSQLDNWKNLIYECTTPLLQLEAFDKKGVVWNHKNCRQKCLPICKF